MANEEAIDIEEADSTNIPVKPLGGVVFITCGDRFDQAFSQSK